MFPLKKEATLNQLGSDKEASDVLEKLIISEDLIQKAAKSAMEAKAFTLSANLSNVRSKLLIEIYGILNTRKHLIPLVSSEAQQIYRDLTEKHKVEDKKNAVTTESVNSRR